MRLLGKFQYHSSEEKIKLPLDKLQQGINNYRNHIIKKNEGEIEYVIDKYCDHAGGKLIVKGQMAVCPMHGWQLSLENLSYNNSHHKKERKIFDIINENLVFENSSKHLINPFLGKKKDSFEIRWLNHASLLIKKDNFSLITDPWLFGPAFLNGWWLNEPSHEDSLELLKNADVLYISHNHPDHLHPETLSILRKDIQIITPKFQSSSSAKYLDILGFKNIKELDFLDIYEIGNDFKISILKSGDFRDDSGLYIDINGYQILLTVDSNFLNNHVLPNRIDFLMTAFASGASGFPLCYENYNESEKQEIIERNRNSAVSNVVEYVKVTKPKYYMPYAGMFEERASRDNYIKESNLKNNFITYQHALKKTPTSLIKPDLSKKIIIKDDSVSMEDLKGLTLQKEDVSFYIESFKKENSYDPKQVIEYFKNSNFHSNQILYIIPTDDDFKPINTNPIYINFQTQEFEEINVMDINLSQKGYRIMKLKIRFEALMGVINNFLPWEDMAIGFQLRIYRTPNSYESNFWYHFTNNYIAKENFRYSKYCGACSIINQSPIWVNSVTLKKDNQIK